MRTLKELRKEAESIYKDSWQPELMIEAFMEGVKASRKQPQEKALYNTYKKMFEQTFLEKYEQAYYFQPVDGAKIKSLIKKITHAYKSNGVIPSDTQLIDGFYHILQRAYNNEWIRNNFTLSIIDSQFNNLKINKSTRNDKFNTDLQQTTESLANKYLNEE